MILVEKLHCGASSCMFLTDPAPADKVARKIIGAMHGIDSGTLITACQKWKSAFVSALQGKALASG